MNPFEVFMTAFADTGVARAQRYCYQLQAVSNAEGRGPCSSGWSVGT